MSTGGTEESERPVPVAKPLSSGFDGVVETTIEPKRKTIMTAKDKIARRKLSLLELAADLSNVSRACKNMLASPLRCGWRGSDT